MGCQLKTGQSGYTLVEIIVVIAIMLIILSMVATTLMSKSPDYSLRAEANQIAARIQAARATAIQQGTAVTISRIDTDSWRVTQAGASGQTFPLPSGAKFGSPDAAVDLPVANLGSYAPSLVISPTGAATPGHIYLQSRLDGNLALRISTSAAGAPVVTKWDGSAYR